MTKKISDLWQKKNIVKFYQRHLIIIVKSCKNIMGKCDNIGNLSKSGKICQNGEKIVLELWCNCSKIKMYQNQIKIVTKSWQNCRKNHIKIIATVLSELYQNHVKI